MIIGDDGVGLKQEKESKGIENQINPNIYQTIKRDIRTIRITSNFF